MTSMKRRLLSLLMAMVMVCSLMPVALAAEGDPEPPEGEWTKGTGEGATDLCENGHTSYSFSETKAATCTEKGSGTWTCDTCKGYITGDTPKKDHTWDTENGKVDPEPTCTEDGKITYTCTECKTATKTETVSATGHSKGDSPSYKKTKSATTHTYKCVTCKKDVEELHQWGTAEDKKNTCVLCGYEKTVEPEYKIEITSKKSTVDEGGTLTLTAKVTKDGEAVEDPELTWTTNTAGEKVVKVDSESGKVEGLVHGKATVTVSYTPDDASEAIKDDVVITVECGLTIGYDVLKLTSLGAEAKLTASYDGKKLSYEDVDWEISTSNGSRYVTLEESKSGNAVATVTAKADTPSGGVTITAEYKDGDKVVHTASQTITVDISAQNAATVTVYTSSTSYYLDDPDDEGDSSIEDQLDSYFTSKTQGWYGLESVVFGTKTDTYGKLDVKSNEEYYAEDQAPTKGSYYMLSDAVFVPGTKTGSAVFTITANVYSNSNQTRTDEVECTITFKVEDGTSSGDVIFYGTVGEDISFDAASFEDFWDDNFSGGTLSYVNFTVSGGTLRDGDGKTVNSSKDCYASPRSTQVGLDELYFEPSSANSKKATTISFSFTASGYKKNSNTLTEKKGTVSIVYMNASPKDINYSVNTSGTVNLKASDFTAAYKEATGSSAPSNLTIVFQNVPKSGTLKYTDSSKKSASAVTLKSNTIKSRSFTTKSSGTNQIGDVTYEGKSTDTIEYIAYSGSTPKFKGNVVFNGKSAAPQDVVVTFQSVNGQAAAFSQTAFVTANAALTNAAKYRFAIPTNGSLYLNGTSSASGIDLLPALLNSVTYRPKAGYNGTERITFVAYDANSTLVGSGTVVVTVTGNSTTNGGVTNASQFTDVKSNAWYFSYLSDLVSKGIITGRGNGKFDPTGTVTYGEALKMVLEAAGHSAAVGTGNDWAIHYKELAVQNRWIDSSISLTAPISREATAELIARVLGVSYSTSTSPFADTTNGYVVALYYTNPQIFIGNITNGQRLFNTNDPLLRQEVCAIICRINEYHLARTTNTMPDGI